MNFRAMIALLFIAVAAVAQTPTAPPADGSRTYTAADFAQFAPRTALDMLNRVPGFAIRQEDEERGLGEASGNVLINGQRLSGKSNDVLTELSRIPAANVERIEVVDAATLKVPGLTGQIANVIVQSGGIKGQFAYRPEFRAYNTDPLLTRFEVSMSGKQGPVEYTLGLDNRGSRSGAGGPTWIYDARGTMIEERRETWNTHHESPRVSGRFVWDAPGDAIGNLNLTYGRLYYDYLETGTRIGANAVDRDRRVDISERGDNYEAGADYEFGLGKGRLKMIGVLRGNHYPSSSTVVTEYADGSAATGDRFTLDGEENEIIGRGEYRWKAGGEWQISAEGAFNSLDNTSRLFELDSRGAFAEVELTGGTAQVKEDRYEVMGSYGRALTPSLQIKLSAGGEYSQLEQVGSGGTTRDFYRPKGELSTAWKVSPRTDVNVKLARRVGQLNFYDFLAYVDVNANIENSANPDLVPQQSWELDVETVRNLGKRGTTTLRLYGQQIDDIIDYIPIGVNGQAPGNLDHAVVYGIESRSTFNLDSFGFDGARLDTHLRWQDSEVEDPLTGEKRPISGSLQEFASVSLRHDVPKTDWAWGSDASYQWNARRYRLTEVGRQWEGPIWASVYAEHKNVYGLTVRAQIGNLVAADSMWDRVVYNGRRTGDVAFIEERDRTIGPIFSFAIRGKF